MNKREDKKMFVAVYIATVLFIIDNLLFQPFTKKQCLSQE